MPDVINRAYTLLHVKAFDNNARTIRGVATTPEMDRQGDIVVPEGIVFSNPSPLLWQHQHDKAVGRVIFDKPTKSGMTFVASLPVIEQAGALKDRVDEAWDSVRYGLVTAVSIGFRVLDSAIERLSGGGLKYLRTEVLELSLVGIPANSSASITAIKAFDAQLLRRAAFDPRGLVSAIKAKRPLPVVYLDDKANRPRLPVVYLDGRPSHYGAAR